MRATRAYIASAGTATVMLIASVGLFALVSTLVAFGSWPGIGSGAQVDQVLLNNVVKARPKPVAVRAGAVTVAQRDGTRRDVVAQARSQRPQKARAVARTRSGRPVGKAPRGSSPRGSAPTGSTPTDSTRAATEAPAGGSTPVAQVPAAAPEPVKQGVQNVTQTVQDTTDQVVGQVTQPVQNVTNQVGQVVDQVAAPVQQTAAPVVKQVQDTAGSVLPH